MKLVLLRHGESITNQHNIFTGWLDVPLSLKGEQEATAAGKMLLDDQIIFQTVYTSMLQRAIKTTVLVLEQLQQNDLPLVKSWRLNERHYGLLQGENKAEMARKLGEQQVQHWRSSYLDGPPKDRTIEYDRQYAFLDQRLLPKGESLKETETRVIPIWLDQIAPQIIRGENVLIVAHKNSLRALTKYLEAIPDNKIAKLHMQTGEPVIYELNNQLKIIDKKILKKRD